jgi:hypothetical protein
MAAMLELAERVRAASLAQRAFLEQAITSAIEAAGLTVVRAEPAEELAACPEIVQQIPVIFQASAFPRTLGGQIGSLTGLPVIADEALPLGEVHLRPHPRLAGEAS